MAVFLWLKYSPDRNCQLKVNNLESAIPADMILASREPKGKNRSLPKGLHLVLHAYLWFIEQLKNCKVLIIEKLYF